MFPFLTKISLKCVPGGPTDNNSALLQVMALHWIGNKPLPGAMMAKISDAISCHNEFKFDLVIGSGDYA